MIYESWKIIDGFIFKLYLTRLSVTQIITIIIIIIIIGRTALLESQPSLEDFAGFVY
jgi:hypothetical protein